MNYYDSDLIAGLAAFAGILLVFLLIAAAGGLVLYILHSIGMMTIAKNRGLPNPWLVWIPVVGAFTLGSITDDINAKEGGNSYYRFILLGGSILSMILSGAGNMFTFATIMSDPEDIGRILARSGANGFGSLISLAFFVITVICLNRLYKCYRPGSSTSWTVLSVIFPFMQSIFPFVIRNDQPNWINPPYQGGPGGGQSWQSPPQGGYSPNQQPPANPYMNNNPQQPPYQGAPGGFPPSGGDMYDEPSRSPLEDDNNGPTQL